MNEMTPSMKPPSQSGNQPSQSEQTVGAQTVNIKMKNLSSSLHNLMVHRSVDLCK